MLVPMKEPLLAAMRGGYAVPGFNFFHQSSVEGIVEEAEALGAPVVLMISGVYVRSLGVEVAAAMGRRAAETVRTPVSLHLDHGDSFELAEACVNAGFTSVMIDGSRLPVEENIALTKRVIAMARPKGVTVEAELEKYGVEVPAISRLEGVASSLAGIWVDTRGERIIVNYLDPEFPQNADWLPLDEVAEFDCVLADIRWPAGAERALRAAAAAGVPSVLDGDRAPTAEILRTLAPLAGHAVFSEGGLAMFSGEADPEAGLLGAGSIPGVKPYVTLGDKGCLWLDKGAVRSLPAFTVEAADTTGAGDVFHGAFALALAEGMEIGEGLRFASGASALKCTRPGGRAGIPDRATLDEFLSTRRNDA